MKRVLLIADICKDIYHMGYADRISPEAPVPVFIQDHNIVSDGMGLNVYNNLKKLQLAVTPIYPTRVSFKHRYVDLKSKQQLIRVDEDAKQVSCNIVLTDIIQYDSFDAIVVSDYDKGFISMEFLKRLAVIADRYSIPLFIDSKKKNIFELTHCIIKINEKEFKDTGWNFDPVAASFERVNLIVTYGDKGAKYQDTHWFPVKKKIEVRDVTGAGDTFLAALVYQYLHSNSYLDAIRFANKAASITVQKFGTYAPTIQEINRV